MLWIHSKVMPTTCSSAKSSNMSSNTQSRLTCRRQSDAGLMHFIVGPNTVTPMCTQLYVFST